MDYDILFAYMAQRETDFYQKLADYLHANTDLKCGFLSMYEPANANLRKSGYEVISLHEMVSNKTKFCKDLMKEVQEKYNIEDLRTLLVHEKLTFNRLDEEKLLAKLIEYDKFFNELCLKLKSKNTVVVQELGGFIAQQALFNNCKAHGIDHIFTEPALYKGRLFLNYNSREPNISDIAAKEDTKKIVQDYIAAYHADKTVVIPAKDVQHFLDAGIKKFLNKRNLKRLKEKIFFKYIKRQKDECDAISNHIRRFATMWFRRKLLNKYYVQPNFEQNYVYYPLHVPLDVQLTLREPKYLDQIALLEKFTQTLPEGIKLYVKEHPASIGAYNFLQLKSLLKNKKVCLIHPKCNSYDIVKNAKTILTINSKVGAEAIMQGKRIMVLGKPYYAQSKQAVLLKSLEELKGVDWGTFHDMDVDIEYLSKIYESCYTGELYGLSTENVKDFSNSLCSLLASKGRSYAQKT